MKQQETEEIFTKIDKFTTKLCAAVDDGNVAAKSVVMILLESLETSRPATQPAADDKLKTLKEIAAHMRVGTKTIRRWIDERDFPSRSAGDDYRFSVTDVDRWTLEDHKKHSNNNGHK